MGSDEKLRRSTSHASETVVGDVTDIQKQKEVDALLSNPLAGKTDDQLERDVDEWVERTGLEDIRELVFKAALIARDRDNFEQLPQLTEEDKAIMRMEKEHPYRQTKTLYSTVFLCSMAAVVQGMDETVINGANLFYPEQFGIGSESTHDTILLGLVASAPYLCSAVFSCWLTYPLNKYFGRRGAIFITTFCAGVGCIWGAVVNSWWHLFISRLFLGIGIGPKSATVPVFAAEIAPARIRGFLAMQWQTWTAFGICLGTVSSLIFQKVPDKPGITGLNWRLMLGSACLPAVFVCAQVFFCPESPRWLLGKQRHRKAWESLLKFRRTPLQAAVDLYYTSKCIEVEEELSRNRKRSRVVEMVAVPRNRRAVLASTVVMFMQQFCGINAIAYYSSTIFINAGQSVTTSLLGSFGYGLINWVFSFPAFISIDRWGRRSLLLFTLPFLSIFMFVAGAGFYVDSNNGQLALVTTGIYIFAAFYGPGAGPVPFTYSAEVYPLQVREIGMAWATAVTWLFNFINALVFPLQIRQWTSFGAFAWFGGWNLVLWFLVLMFCPETKGFTLEELDDVFSMSTARQARYGLQSPAYWFRRYILRQKVHRVGLQHFHPSEEKDKAEVQHRELV
ncbi:sugar transporter-domain-containing protein [Rhodotorula diobovata]|uniref:Sugar transporter-domain-containing protein n=1 Tax=Rhodotorula diobovata TaxID=5288 RepID=A0A5C5FY41_9BASI|nr:sugar transporter-domain-containing protein [Rhodotorula diobovata]